MPNDNKDNNEITNSRSGFVALIGAPNAGKSTLLNHMVGTKISIVTHKVQTTRARVIGVTIANDTQIAFIDTPGIFKPKRRLDRAMVAAAWSGVSDADEVVLLIDATVAFNDENMAIINSLNEHNRKVILAINKIDLIKRDGLLKIAEKLNDMGCFSDVFMISATRGNGTDDLLRLLANAMPEGHWLFPEEQLTDMPQMLLAAEVTREKLYINVHQELPYALSVETDTWENFKDGSIKIEQTIYVRRDSQKSIILGKGGQKIKTIGAAARIELEEIFSTRIHLMLFVKVKQGWQDDPSHYNIWNLDFNA